ncbi:MAG: EF-P lysine aminoacylase EpmA [Pseudomonadota bacterium]
MPVTEVWRPSASLDILRARAELLARMRAFFRQAGVMEVETPACSHFGVTDPAIESFTTRYTGPAAAKGERLYLHSSPEFPMKRLLAAGSGPIYQVCKVFRGGELGTRHNPEFTLLEWYRPGFDHLDLMAEVAELVNGLQPEQLAVERLTYAEAFQRYLAIDPHAASLDELRYCAIDNGIAGAEGLALEHVDGWLDLLLSHIIEPRLGKGRMTFLHDYPATQAALSRVRAGDPPVAERFELYLNGMEIANGFHELTNAAEQRKRFAQDNRERVSQGLAVVPMDTHLLSALQAGLPDSAGVALGIDRLLMYLTRKKAIREVLAFPYGIA